MVYVPGLVLMQVPNRCQTVVVHHLAHGFEDLREGFNN